MTVSLPCCYACRQRTPRGRLGSFLGVAEHSRSRARQLILPAQNFGLLPMSVYILKSYTERARADWTVG